MPLYALHSGLRIGFLIKGQTFGTSDSEWEISAVMTGGFRLFH